MLLVVLLLPTEAETAVCGGEALPQREQLAGVARSQRCFSRSGLKALSGR